MTVTVQLLKPQGRDLYTPGFPVRFFAPTVVTEPSAGPILGGIKRPAHSMPARCTT